MSAQEKFAPYLNRFTTLLQQNAAAILEFKCKDGKVTVSLSHELGGVEKAQPTTHLPKPSVRNTQKKAVKPSQIRRLQKRAAARAEQSAGAACEQVINKTEKQNTEPEAEKVEVSAETAEKTRDEMEKAEAAKVDLEKDQTEPDESDGPLVRAEYEKAKSWDMPVGPYALSYARACDEYNRKHGPFRCSFCRIPFETREQQGQGNQCRTPGVKF